METHRGKYLLLSLFAFIRAILTIDSNHKAKAGKNVQNCPARLHLLPFVQVKIYKYTHTYYLKLTHHIIQVNKWVINGYNLQLRLF